MNENRLNFPEIQDAHLDQMIRLAFAQEAALLAQEWMAQSETPETPQEQERAERLLRRMRVQSPHPIQSSGSMWYISNALHFPAGHFLSLICARYSS